MDKYEQVAAREGVELAPFTGGYLDLYGSKGISVLEEFIKENPDVKVISTTEIEGFVKKKEGYEE